MEVYNRWLRRGAARAPDLAGPNGKKTITLVSFMREKTEQLADFVNEANSQGLNFESSKGRPPSKRQKGDRVVGKQDGKVWLLDEGKYSGLPVPEIRGTKAADSICGLWLMGAKNDQRCNRKGPVSQWTFDEVFPPSHRLRKTGGLSVAERNYRRKFWDLISKHKVYRGDHPSVRNIEQFLRERHRTAGGKQE